MNGEKNKKVYYFYDYLLYYFSFLYFAVLFISYFHSTSLIFSSTLRRELFICITLYAGLIYMNYNKTGYFRPFYALIELFPLFPLFFYLKGKFFSADEDLIKYFKKALFLFIFMFLFTFLISLFALIYKPFFFSIIQFKLVSGYLVPVNLPVNFISFIIVHNAAFLLLIFLGSPFIFIPTFAGVYIMAITVMPILAGSLLDGYFNYILPNGLLEISGTIIGGASAFILFILVIELLKNSIKSIKPYLNFILAGVIMSASSFLFAWPMEVLLALTPIAHYSSIRLFYFIDFYIFIVDLIIILKLIYSQFIPAIEYFALYFYITLFLFGLISLKMPINRIYLIIFGSMSLYFLFDSLINVIYNKKLKSYTINNEEFGIFSIRGTSMNHALRSGDILITKKVSNINDIKIGDIITFKTSNIYYPLNAAGTVSHRVIDFTDDKIITKGDNMKKKDPMKILYSDILGVAIAKISHTDRKTTRLEMIKNEDEFAHEMLEFVPLFLSKHNSSILINLYLAIISIIIMSIILGI